MWTKYRLYLSALSGFTNVFLFKCIDWDYHYRFSFDISKSFKNINFKTVPRLLVKAFIRRFYIVFLILILIAFIMIISIFSSFISVSKNIIPVIMLLNSIYIFLNLWYYFVNIYKYSNYTSSVQRFWKRTLMLFWIIELFLFLIFAYLWLISPEETSFFIDSYRQNHYFFVFEKENFYYLFSLVIILYSLFEALFQKKKNNHILSFFFSFLALAFLLLTEYLRFIQLLNFTSMREASYFIHKVNKSVLQSSETLSTLVVNENYNSNVFYSPTYSYRRTSLHFNSLVVFLKFWHFVFVAVIMLLTFQKVLSKEALSFDMIASNIQNTIILYFFFLLNYLFFLKKYFYIFLKYIYFWFYEDYSMREFFIFTLFEIIHILKNLL